MDQRAEAGFEERRLSKRQWRRLLKTFRSGSVRWAIKALRAKPAIYQRQAQRAGYTLGGIQAVLNERFRKLKMPYKAVRRQDGFQRNEWGFGRIPINPWLLLLQKKRKSNHTQAGAA